jgi:hypothetical protein
VALEAQISREISVRARFDIDEGTGYERHHNRS